MMRLSRRLFAITSFAMMLSSAPAYAQGVDMPFIMLGRSVETPRGMVDMCATERSDFCGEMGEAPASATMAAGPSGDYATSALAGEAAPITHQPLSLCDIVAAVMPNIQPIAAQSSNLPSAAPMRFDVPLWSDPFDRPPLPALTDAAISAQPSFCGADIARPFLAPVADLAVMMADIDSLPDAAAPAAAPALLAQADPAILPAIDGKGAMKTLKTINRFVNSRVIQRTDWESYNSGEVWRRSGVGKGAQGDCEDIAIEKRFQLVASGFPPDRLSFAVVYMPQVGLHTILIARLPDGDYVLDSRTPFIERWNRTGYSWLSVQNFQAPEQWRAPATPAEYASMQPAPAPKA